MGMEGEGNEASEFSLSRLFHNLETAEYADALKYDPPGCKRKKIINYSVTFFMS